MAAAFIGGAVMALAVHGSLNAYWCSYVSTQFVLAAVVGGFVARASSKTWGWSRYALVMVIAAVWLGWLLLKKTA